MTPSRIHTVQTPFKMPNATNKVINPNYTELREYFVSKSRGSDVGHALTVGQFQHKVKNLIEANPDKSLYWAITDEGQFQLYVTIYTKQS